MVRIQMGLRAAYRALLIESNGVIYNADLMALIANALRVTGQDPTAILKDVTDRLAEGKPVSWREVPYPQHCTQPEICMGKSNCQRDPNCID
jgi:hypothetical protein